MPRHAPTSSLTRVIRNGLLVTATTTAVVAAAFAVAPAATEADPAASSVAAGVSGGQRGSAESAPGRAASRGGDRAARPSTTAPTPAAGTSAQTQSQAPAAAPPAGPATTGSDPAAVPAPAPAPAASYGPPSTGDRIFIGSVAGGYEQALAGTGVDLANHAYAFFSSKVPVAEMITVSAGNVKWRDVAAAGPGSTLYNQIVGWAQTIKARGGAVMVAYNHEPEAHDRHTLGSAAEFIAAWRHVVSIFDQQGASNVVWTWQMTAYAFRVSPSSEQYAPKWYPGDDWVDNIGADAYNWISCGATGTGKYNELQFLGDPVVAFARAHGKKASFPEFASHANANRAQWLENAHRYLAQNQDIITAAFYFNRPPTIASNADCRWGLTGSTEYAQLREMAQDTAHFTV
jgi:Glycosyl hydrolase family 26